VFTPVPTTLVALAPGRAFLPASGALLQARQHTASHALGLGTNVRDMIRNNIR
jgi:hypothetical protein